MEKLIKRQGMPLKSTFAECVAAPDYKLYIVKKRLSEKYGVIRRDKTDIVPFLFDRYEVIELNEGYIIALTKDNIRQYCLYHSKFGTILNKCLDKFEIKISDIEERKKSLGQSAPIMLRSGKATNAEFTIFTAMKSSLALMMK